MTTSQATGKCVFDAPDHLLGAVGRDLGVTDWSTVEAAQVTGFAEATGSPGVGDEVPAMMVLSLTNRFLPDLMEVRGVSNGVNYGTGPVRFPARLRIGERIRASARLIDAAVVAGGAQTTVEVTVEVEGSAEPACVVESLSRWMR